MAENMAENNELPEGYFKPEHIPTTIADIRVGDIFHCHWGATMAMNDYYKVIKRTAKTVTLRKLCTKSIAEGFLSGKQYPIDKFEDYSNMYCGHRKEYPDGKVYCEMTKKLPDSLDKQGRIWIKLSNYQFASPWDGRLDYFDYCD